MWCRADADSVQPPLMSEIDFRKLLGWPFIWFGLIGSGVYLLVVVLLLGSRLLTLHTLRPNEIGDTLAGIFAPLALIWLIVGILQQGRELRIQVQDLKESVEAQKALAKASGGQERLQNEQFVERTYRLYKRACEDVLCRLLRSENLQYTNTNQIRDYVVPQNRIERAHELFHQGRRSEILTLAVETQRRLEKDSNVSILFADTLKQSGSKPALTQLAEDFASMDDLRISALANFQGGDVLGQVDNHEGFAIARRLTDGIANFLRSHA